MIVAVTGPTGELGRAFLRALQRDGAITRVLGMARRPFDRGDLTKLEYRQGDVLDPEAVDALARDADVLVHLAFIIMGGREETRHVNLTGSRNVFKAARKHVERLVYTSSVAAYGFHSDNPQPLTEDVAPRGSERFYYSHQKAELERALGEEFPGAYVLRPCIVAGPDAPMLLRQLPPKPLLIPDPGTRFQLVHHDDVATALVAATKGEGEPGAYNLAGDGTISLTDLARATGRFAYPIPRLLLEPAALGANLPLVPTLAQWVNALRTPVIMDTGKARKQLGWRPRYDSRATLDELVRAIP
ncbi:NAD-dependent epimerase/dehydratase family protein [Solirubrobacter ginsenosidimutans]|uniref:NAD-dependent epimerase/dehydratase family protein n=1 Tax=Solirubrobacter ginsenosidimutans TaxID=490573 RepID=A0A9X3MWN3_9ACTN|nr:NAD-dependent epimerase/dehydratase family protein [Solirubrobacter ginsenosidimutans]MDA0162708.1 NAD-dependent epimerase/dehydratase family protein [Solirubrobacter ginsenosidimutans]